MPVRQKESKLTHPTKFALIGSGSLGQHIVEELLKKDLSVRILSRDSTQPQFTQLRKRGVEIVDVDYNSPDSISAALKGVEVIISTIGTDAISTQTKVIDVAAEIESVRLFVPSEFGLGDYLDPELVKVSEVVRHKDLTRKYLESKNLKWVAYAVGSFAGWTYSPYYGWNIADRKAILAGTGKSLWSISHEEDIAAYVVLSLTKLDSSTIDKGRYLKMNSYKVTQEQLVKHAEEALEEFKVQRTSMDAVESNLSLPHPQSLVAFLVWAFDKGYSDYQPDHEEFGFQPRYTFVDLEVK